MQLPYQLNHYMIPGLLLIRMRTFKNSRELYKTWNLFRKAKIHRKQWCLVAPSTLPTAAPKPRVLILFGKEAQQETMGTSKNTTGTWNQQLSFLGCHLWFLLEWHRKQPTISWSFPDSSLCSTSKLDSTLLPLDDLSGALQPELLSSTQASKPDPEKKEPQ